MKGKIVGGFTLVRSVSRDDLKNFIAIFSKEQTEEAEEDGVKNRKLAAIKLVKFSQIKEKLKDVSDDDQKVDR